ncbi:remorin-like isoform X1 [Salvia hispanica]|uniref:remorin-like isoform X1 n=1 Tax=Salvia hispanica TaxID=49212 RepID=UPI002008F166|nr:remorin-like isoform X1 [Salvia hispanica]
MAEEEVKAVEPKPTCADADVAEEEKAVVPLPLPPALDKPDDSKALVVVQIIAKQPEAAEEEKKPEEGSVNRDAVLARVATEKRLSLIKAWEESEKSKAENKAQKNMSSVVAWENSKKATLDAELKKIEEQLEKKKAGYIEKTKNKIAALHKQAEEKRALIEAKRGEDLLKAEETSAKYRATGTGPKKLLGCF